MLNRSIHRIFARASASLFPMRYFALVFGLLFLGIFGFSMAAEDHRVTGTIHRDGTCQIEVDHESVDADSSRALVSHFRDAAPDATSSTTVLCWPDAAKLDTQLFLQISDLDQHGVLPPGRYRVVAYEYETGRPEPRRSVTGTLRIKEPHPERWSAHYGSLDVLHSDSAGIEARFNLILRPAQGS